MLRIVGGLCIFSIRILLRIKFVKMMQHLVHLHRHKTHGDSRRGSPSGCSFFAHTSINPPHQNFKNKPRKDHAVTPARGAPYTGAGEHAGNMDAMPPLSSQGNTTKIYPICLEINIQGASLAGALMSFRLAGLLETLLLFCTSRGAEKRAIHESSL